MTTVLPLAYRHVRDNAGLVALATIGLVALALLVFVVLFFVALPVHRLDGPELAPFRWWPLESVA